MDVCFDQPLLIITGNLAFLCDPATRWKLDTASVYDEESN